MPTVLEALLEQAKWLQLNFTMTWVFISTAAVALLLFQLLIRLPWIVIKSNADLQEQAVDACTTLTGIVRNLLLRDSIDTANYKNFRLRNDFYEVWVSFPKQGMVNEDENGFLFPSLANLPRVGDEISLRGVEAELEKETIDKMLRFNKDIFISSFKVMGITWSPFGNKKIISIELEESDRDVFFRGKDL